MAHTGRPKKLTEEEIKQLPEFLQDDPRSMKRVAARVQETFNKIISVDTLKRWAKQSGRIASLKL